MIEVGGNLWDYLDQPFCMICITTNGTVKRDGSCVMGRGCALEAAKRIPGIAQILGKKIRDTGNSVHWIKDTLWSFPVKHNWWEKADLVLIKQSVRELTAIATSEAYKHNTFVLPRPGCGNGHLLWEDVRPLLLSLPDNVHVISFH